MEKKETNWEQRWQTKETQWDLGGVTPALQEELDKLQMTSGEALVPGCGAAYDLSAIATRYEFVTGIDLAPSAVEIAREKNKVRRELYVESKQTHAHTQIHIQTKGFFFSLLLGLTN